MRFTKNANPLIGKWHLLWRNIARSSTTIDIRRSVSFSLSLSFSFLFSFSHSHSFFSFFLFLSKENWNRWWNLCDCGKWAEMCHKSLRKNKGQSNANFVCDFFSFLFFSFLSLFLLLFLLFLIFFLFFFFLISKKDWKKLRWTRCRSLLWKANELKRREIEIGTFLWLSFSFLLFFQLLNFVLLRSTDYKWALICFETIFFSKCFDLRKKKSRMKKSDRRETQQPPIVLKRAIHRKRERVGSIFSSLFASIFFIQKVYFLFLFLFRNLSRTATTFRRRKRNSSSGTWMSSRSGW